MTQIKMKDAAKRRLDDGCVPDWLDAHRRHRPQRDGMRQDADNHAFDAPDDPGQCPGLSRLPSAQKRMPLQLGAVNLLAQVFDERQQIPHPIDKLPVVVIQLFHLPAGKVFDLLLYFASLLDRVHLRYQLRAGRRHLEQQHRDLVFSGKQAVPYRNLDF